MVKWLIDRFQQHYYCFFIVIIIIISTVRRCMILEAVKCSSSTIDMEG